MAAASIASLGVVDRPPATDSNCVGSHPETYRRVANPRHAGAADTLGQGLWRTSPEKSAPRPASARAGISCAGAGAGWSEASHASAAGPGRHRPGRRADGGGNGISNPRYALRRPRKSRSNFNNLNQISRAFGLDFPPHSSGTGLETAHAGASCAALPWPDCRASGGARPRTACGRVWSTT